MVRDHCFTMSGLGEMKRWVTYLLFSDGLLAVLIWVSGIAVSGWCRSTANTVFARKSFESQASVTRGEPAKETGAMRHGAEVTPAGS